MFNKSIALSVLLGVCSTSAIAAQDITAKLNTIKAMYQHHKSDLDTLPHYVNASLKKAFRQQDRMKPLQNSKKFATLKLKYDPPIGLIDDHLFSANRTGTH